MGCPRNPRSDAAWPPGHDWRGRAPPSALRRRVSTHAELARPLALDLVAVVGGLDGHSADHARAPSGREIASSRPWRTSTPTRHLRSGRARGAAAAGGAEAVATASRESVLTCPSQPVLTFPCDGLFEAPRSPLGRRPSAAVPGHERTAATDPKRTVQKAGRIPVPPWPRVLEYFHVYAPLAPNHPSSPPSLHLLTSRLALSGS